MSLLTGGLHYLTIRTADLARAKPSISARAELAARHDASDLTPFPVGRITR